MRIPKADSKGAGRTELKSSDGINPPTKLVIPAAAERRAGIQKRPCNYWIDVLAGMTRGSISVGLFICQVNNKTGKPPVIS